MTNTKRTNNCKNGTITFDGSTIYKDGQPFETFDHIVNIIAEKLRAEKLIICFYRDKMVHFKTVNRQDFLKCPEAFLYFNGNADSFEFSFRFIAKYADFLLSLPDALDKNGKKLTLTAEEYCNRYNHLIINRQTTKYGYISEYHISHNKSDLRDRAKKHDVYTKYTTKSGQPSKYCIAFEVKTSLTGTKDANFIAYSKEKGIVPMSSGYKKSNALFRVEI